MRVGGGESAGRVDRERLLGLALVVLSACGYGSGALFAKPVYASGVDWLTLLAWRFFLGAALCWAWLLAWPGTRRALRQLSRRRFATLVALGVFFVGNSATYYAALETVPASLAAVIVYVYPALVAVLALRFVRRLEGGGSYVGLAIALVGVALALGGIDAAGAPPLGGLLLTIASPIIYSAWIVASMRLSGERPGAPLGGVPAEAGRPDETDSAPAAAIILTAAWLVYLVAAVVTGRPVTPAQIPPDAWLGLIGVGVFSTAIATQAFYAGARRIGAAHASLVSTVEPVYTITLATVLFGELLTPLQLAGGALVIFGVLLAQTSDRPSGRPALETRGAEAA